MQPACVCRGRLDGLRTIHALRWEGKGWEDFVCKRGGGKGLLYRAWWESCEGGERCDRRRGTCSSVGGLELG